MAKILTKKPNELFEKHLHSNERVVFSGCFGIGKSTFLNDFFTSRREDYFAITLRPIDYSITSNEDIYELIKYDVLVQLLLSDEVAYDDFGTFTFWETLSFYVASSPTLVDILVGQFSKIGDDRLQDVEKVYHISQLVEKKLAMLQEQHVAVNSNQDAKKVGQYLSKVESGQFLLKNDFIMNMIKETLELIRKKLQRERNTVLIIDDLDRIDPEHIFRIFNVFAARLGVERISSRSFSFSRIVFVCDIENIKSIYAHKYGSNTDFNGYADKFYSNEIFSFNNKDAVIEWIIRNVGERNLFNLKDIEKLFVVETLTILLHYNLINLRSLVKIEHTVDLRTEFRNPIDHELGFLWSYFLLRRILGSHSSLVDAIGKLKSKIGIKGRNQDDALILRKELHSDQLLLPIIIFNTISKRNVHSNEDQHYVFKEGGHNSYMVVNRSEHNNRLHVTRKNTAATGFYNTEDYLNAIVHACDISNKLFT